MVYYEYPVGILFQNLTLELKLYMNNAFKMPFLPTKVFPSSNLVGIFCLHNSKIRIKSITKFIYLAGHFHLNFLLQYMYSLFLPMQVMKLPLHLHVRKVILAKRLIKHDRYRIG